MKKLIFCNICYVLLFGLAACSKEVEIQPQPQPEFDPPHSNVNISILDAETGESLLDPFTYFSTLIFNDKTTATAFCMGQQYELSRYDQPYYDRNAPFRLERYTQNGSYHHRLVFDGFTIKEPLHERLVILWESNSSFYENFTIELLLTAEIDNSETQPKIIRSYTFDGTTIETLEGENWEVYIFHKINRKDEIIPGYNLSEDASGKWEICDLEASLNGTQLTSYNPKEAIFATNWFIGDTGLEVSEDLRMNVDVVLDGDRYRILVPAIAIIGGEDNEKKKYFRFDQEITDGKMKINDEETRVIKMVVKGDMFLKREIESTSEIVPLYIYGPQTDYYSDLTFTVECDTCTFVLRMNYLRVIGDRDWFL